MKASTTTYCYFLFFTLCCCTGLIAQQTLQLNSLDSTLKLAERKSTTIKTGEQQSLLAKWLKIAAIGNAVNLRSPINASWTDNTQLPLSFLPAEAFGGPAGTFKEVAIGQEYITSYQITPQLDIINPAAWARIKSADWSKQLTEVNNQVAKKSLLESVAAAYYNIVSLQQQLINLQRGVNAADSVVMSVKNKFALGLVREQDVNNAQVNLLTMNDRFRQAQLSLEQNYNHLKILCDLDVGMAIQVTETIDETIQLSDIKITTSSLLERQAQLQRSYLKSEWNSNRLLSFSPTVSLVFNQGWQQNSNTGFFDNNANTFSSQYIGLRLTVPFPLDVTRLSQNYTAGINYRIAEINATHAQLQNKNTVKQLSIDYEKATSACVTAKQISQLKETNYHRSRHQYEEGIISTEQLLMALMDYVNARVNYDATLAGVKYAEAKITINNRIP